MKWCPFSVAYLEFLHRISIKSKVPLFRARFYKNHWKLLFFVYLIVYPNLVNFHDFL